MSSVNGAAPAWSADPIGTLTHGHMVPLGSARMGVGERQGSFWPSMGCEGVKGTGGRPHSRGDSGPATLTHRHRGHGHPARVGQGGVRVGGEVPQAACLLCPCSGDQALLRGHCQWLLAVLPQLLRVDVSTLDMASSRLDSAVAICFGPAPPSHLLVSMSSKVVVLDSISGHIVRKVSPGPWPVAWPPLPSRLQLWCPQSLEGERCWAACGS